MLLIFRWPLHNTYNPKTMKRLKATLMVGLSLATCAHADEFKERANKIAALYNTGMTAVKRGDAARAKASFQLVLQLQPGHGPARHQLNRLQLNIKQVLEKQRVARFKTTKLEQVDLKDASLQEALEALNFLTAKATDKKFTPNFIVQDPAGKLAKKQVNLNMRNIPLAAALKYVLGQTGARARYDEHATVIRPN